MVDIQWLIGGEAGYGIMTTGSMMAKIFTRLGLSVFDYVEYPSLIRGGHNAYYVRASSEEIFSQKRPIDILVALNKQTIDKHKNELSENAVVVFDPNATHVEINEFSSTISLVAIPLLELTKKLGVDRLMVNTVAIGASLALFYSDFSVLEKIMNDAFSKKGEKIVLENINTSKAGFDYVLSNFANAFPNKVEKKEQNNILISGAEAVTLGAIKAGVKFAAIYPMTPINTIMTTLVSHALKYNIIIKEPEDEISGINMAIGASFTGVRSMTATSGGGFSLMVESVGLSSQTETPLVIIEGMRPGPATGMPTWTAQGDLRFILHAGQDEFPKVILVPGDFVESFTYTMKAFNLAEKYQVPVIILMDKYLLESHGAVNNSELKEKSDEYKIERGKILSDEETEKMVDYKRYQFTEDGVSSRSLPGQKGGIALNGSYEHDERGLDNEDAENRIKMMDKRFKKLENVKSEIDLVNQYGNSDAPLTIIGFGSTKMTILEAIKWLSKEGIQVNFLQVASLIPFPTELLEKALKSFHKTLIIEGNKTGQLEGLIKEKTGYSIDYHFRKYDGRPFYPEEIVEKVKSLYSSLVQSNQTLSKDTEKIPTPSSV